MRIKVHCQNRVGILRDILNLLVDYGINVARGEVGGEQGNAIYLYCPNLINLQFQSLRPKFEAIPGVFGVKRVGLMPSERRHLELNALLGAVTPAELAAAFSRVAAMALRDPQEPLLQVADAATLARLRAQGVPQHGRPLDEVLDELIRDVLPCRGRMDHRRFLAHVPGPASPLSMLGDAFCVELRDAFTRMRDRRGE